MNDRRVAARFPHELLVDLHVKGARERVSVTDVSRHGMFLATSRPPPMNHALLLTVRLRGGPFDTMATVVRRVTEQREGALGVGLKLFCLGADAKSRWDRFVHSLETPGIDVETRGTPASTAGACFLIQPESAVALFDFFMHNVVAKHTVYLAPAIRKIDAPVQVILVHPETHDELSLMAHVVEWNPDHPLRMGIRFDNVDVAARRGFKQFLGDVPGAGVLSLADGAPLVSADRPRWTEYAYFSPRVMRDEPGTAPAAPVVEEILLLEELAEPESYTAEALALVETDLLEHPDLADVDARALFDFAWSNDE